MTHIWLLATLGFDYDGRWQELLREAERERLVREGRRSVPPRSPLAPGSCHASADCHPR